MQPELAEAAGLPARKFPKALIAAYVSGLSTRDEMGLGFMLLCGVGAGAGCLAAAAIAIVTAWLRR